MQVNHPHHSKTNKLFTSLNLEVVFFFYKKAIIIIRHLPLEIKLCIILCHILPVI